MFIEYVLYLWRYSNVQKSLVFLELRFLGKGQTIKKLLSIQVPLRNKECAGVVREVNWVET